MSQIFRKIRSFLPCAHVEQRLSSVDSMIVGAFVIGAVGLGLISLLV